MDAVEFLKVRRRICETCHSCPLSVSNVRCLFMMTNRGNENIVVDRVEQWAKEHLDTNMLPCRVCQRSAPVASKEYEKRIDCWRSDEETEKSKPIHDDEDSAVDHPTHYTQGDIECIDAMESAFGAEELAAYCKIAAFKYIWRCKLKNGPEDVDKAMWYLRKFKELKEKGNAEK